MIIDTHMHIFEDEYKDIIDEVINEAIDNDVRKMIAVGFDYQSSLKAIELANKFPFIYASVGLHPSEVLKEKDKELKWIYELAKNKKVIAIGEIGLDYYWDKSFVDEQKEMFIKQLNIANKLKLPVIIHCRDAINDCYKIVKTTNNKGVMHCFSSSLEMAKEFIKLGYYIGIGGVVTFKNSKEIKEIAKSVDLNKIVSETDSPYLTPEPFRGKLNKPGYTKYVVEEIAKLRNENIAKVKLILEENANQLFNL